MNPIGANTWIWVSPLTDERWLVCAAHSGLGFASWSYPSKPGDWDPPSRRILSGLELGHHLRSHARHARSPERQPGCRRLDAGVHQRAASGIAKRVGARTVGGPIYTPVGKTWLMNADARRVAVARLKSRRCRAPFRRCAAERLMLTIEPLNRYETSFIKHRRAGREVVSARRLARLRASRSIPST